MNHLPLAQIWSPRALALAQTSWLSEHLLGAEPVQVGRLAEQKLAAELAPTVEQQRWLHSVSDPAP